MIKRQKHYFILGLLITIIVSIALYTIILYWLSLHIKLGKCIENDGPFVALQAGILEPSKEPDGTICYSGYGYRVFVYDNYITRITDENAGYTKFYNNGILYSISINNPCEEIIHLCTSLSVDPEITFSLRSEDEIHEIQNGISLEGITYLENHNYSYTEISPNYVVVN